MADSGQTAASLNFAPGSR